MNLSTKIKLQVLKQTRRFKFYSRILKFNTPSFTKFSVAMSPNAQGYLEQLKDVGFFITEPKFIDLADYIDSEYFKKMDNDADLKNLLERRKMKNLSGGSIYESGQKQSWYASFQDPRFEELLFDKDLCSTFYNYFHRQPYYRDSVQLTRDVFGEDVSTRIASKFHLDYGLHQLSLVLLIHDITEKETHTLYALRSNRKYRFKETDSRWTYEDSDIEAKFETKKLLGKKGSVLVFDAGNGFHKISEMPNSSRKMFFLNITAGSNIIPNNLDSKQSWIGLQNQPDYIKAMFNKTYAT